MHDIIVAEGQNCSRIANLCYTTTDIQQSNAKVTINTQFDIIKNDLDVNMVTFKDKSIVP